MREFYLLSLKQLKNRKLRSTLTLIGIIIGIAAVVSLITLGQGLQNAISDQFDALGNDKLFIMPKGNEFSPGLSLNAISLTDQDVEVVEKTTGVRRTTGFISTTAKVEFNDNVRYFLVYGQSTDPQERELLGESQNYKIGQGREMQKGDKNKVVLGFDHSQPNLFDKAVEVGDKITVHDSEFKVVGFLEKIGSPPDDTSVALPLDTYRDLFDDQDLGIIVAQIQPGSDPLKVAQSIHKSLLRKRNLQEGKEDFSIQTPEEISATFTTILDIVGAVLLGIAGISLLVGGINIMNTMYTSVLERTKQIGIMKALGAKDNHILTLFIIEAGFYGTLGGVIGITIGVLLAKAVELGFQLAVGPAFLAIRIDPWLLLGTLLFAFVVGALSGLAPARKAAKLNPVDALRYE